MPSLILALDQGTTSSRAILFDETGEPRGSAQKEFQQIFPKAGWVEHDPEEIWSSQISVVGEALARAQASLSDLAAVGITNQRETTIVWDKATGRPVYNAIVWQDRRTAETCDRLRTEGLLPLVRRKTGLVLDAYFSATKIAWILDHVDGARARAERGELLFGTVDSWLIWKLTQGRVHATDATNASRTLLLDISTGQWDDELLGIFKVPRAMLPVVKDSSDDFGVATTELGPLRGVRIGGVAGDQQAALFGQACLKAGMAKNTYGTGCFLLQDVGDTPVASTQGLLTTIARRLHGKTSYALEGSVFIGGAVVQWLRDGLGLISSAAEVEALANSVPDSQGVMLVPAFAGLGAPHWDPYARGLLIGLTRGTTKAHVARAAIESIAFQVADLLQAMDRDTSAPLRELRVDGGASANDSLLQFQADLLGVPVVRSKVAETTALGAAYLAGLQVGFWKSPDEIAARWQEGARFLPKASRDVAVAKRKRWTDAVGRAKAWETPG